jgi:hypothetical protein
MQAVCRRVRRLDGFVHEAAKNLEILSKIKIKKPKTYSGCMMSFPRPIEWYHSHADLIWPAGTFKGLLHPGINCSL